MGLDRYVPVDSGYMLIGLFMLTIAVPALVYSVKEVLAVRKHPTIESGLERGSDERGYSHQSTEP
jgi:hypothetical protein